MKIQLIQGEFDSKDALELITEMVQIKIKYHENKITPQSSEEDIKFREIKIQKLQRELFELRENINSHNQNLKIDGTIKLN